MEDGWVSAAAAGIMAAVAVEVFAGHGHTRAQALGRCLLAGGAAAAYALLVPRSDWGPRSGAKFAHMPAVSALAPAAPSAWGALTGALLRLAA